MVVKKYANRRLYNTETSCYITLDTLALMVRDGRDFTVFDAKTGEDITRSVLTQIIVEEESKGRPVLPTNFLRQLIGFYGETMQPGLPPFLEQAAAYFASQQKQMRSAMEKTIGGLLPPGMEEMSRQGIASNMAMMERAMSLFTPFFRERNPPISPADPPAEGADAGHAALHEEIAALRDEVRRLNGEIAGLRAQARDGRARKGSGG
ncbi:MAG TPA: polyhydroxyalkanoate synthesis repressor PhaR [Acetobacteraceae bacterium]|nr:polyhydroxyalkanoate synthesis repressor PhaR [Acetobacteraceae bacterium]